MPKPRTQNRRAPPAVPEEFVQLSAPFKQLMEKAIGDVKDSK